jgi:hypothetical protein
MVLKYLMEGERHQAWDLKHRTETRGKKEAKSLN